MFGGPRRDGAQRGALLRQVEEGTEPDLLASLHALEQRMRAQPSTAVIVPYADALLPAGDPSFMAQTDRQTYLVFHRWSLDQTLTQGDNIVVLITESLNAINPGLLSNPKVAAIEIPMPDLPLRQKVIGFFAPKLTAHQIDLFSERTSGLRTVQLANILSGNTLSDPKFKDAEKLRTYDLVVANPPFSDKRWSTGIDPLHDPYGRFDAFGVPPAKQGDYAFLLHLIRSMKSTGSTKPKAMGSAHAAMASAARGISRPAAVTRSSGANSMAPKRTHDANANVSTQSVHSYRPASLPADADLERVYTETS